MKLLLHICCAPCTIYPFDSLKNEGFTSVTGFFYNPNIHPYTEYKKREKALQEYSKKHNIPVTFGKYDMDNFFVTISQNMAQGTRCKECWRMRLLETARFAKENNYDAFTTTLLVSPYQDKDLIKEIGMDIQDKYGVRFLYKDFTDGFRESQAKAKEEDIYRQKYCGCVFSERERYDKSLIMDRR